MSTDVTAVKEVGGKSRAKASSKSRWSGGIFSGLACKCLKDGVTDFLLKEDRIVCASCGREVKCTPPIVGMFKATCGCCISTDIKTTFVLDSKGVYTCTWCGRSR